MPTPTGRSPASGEDLLGVAALAAPQVDGEGDGGLGLGDLSGIRDALGGEGVERSQGGFAGALSVHDGEVGGPVAGEPEPEGGGLVRGVGGLAGRPF